MGQQNARPQGQISLNFFLHSRPTLFRPRKFRILNPFFSITYRFGDTGASHRQILTSLPKWDSKMPDPKVKFHLIFFYIPVLHYFDIADSEYEIRFFLSRTVSEIRGHPTVKFE